MTHTNIGVSYCCVLLRCFFANVNRDINHYCNVTIATIDQISRDSKYYSCGQIRNNKLKIFDAVGGAGRDGEVDIRLGWSCAESDARRDKIVPRLHPLLAPG